MSRVIEVEVVKKFLFDKFKIPFDEAVDALPAAETKVEKHGHWSREIIHQPRRGGKIRTDFYYKCSVCLSISQYKTNYCHHCGAKNDLP